ncbi:MAG: hypothetical protein IKP58_09565 [Victivallales bacterium]|nr:hypothetical protein [Victivallales bacterium]
MNLPRIIVLATLGGGVFWCLANMVGVGLGLMEIWKTVAFFMKIGRKSTIQFEIYAQNAMI